jgi:hypothetical protein
MTKEWLWWLGEFGLAATVAIVAGFVTKDVPISILYGLFVGTVSFVLREHRRVVTQQERQVSEMEDKALNLPTTIVREDINPYLKQVILSERNEFLRMAKEVVNGELVMQARPIGQVIMNFYRLAKPGDKVIATNTGVGWGTPHWEVVRQLNFEIAQSGVDWTRIFIELTGATPEDRKRLKQEMDRQKEYIKVRYIKESHVPSGTIKDMALIVDKLLGYGVYSKPVGSGIKQVIDEVRFYSRRDMLDKAKEMAENLIKLSEEYK